MQVFSTYFKILKKNKTPVLIYALLFLGIAIALITKSEPVTGRYETKKVKTMVINEDGQSALVDGFLKYLKNYVVFIEPLKSEEARTDSLVFNETSYILTIPKGFAENFMKDGTVKLRKQTAPNSVEAMSMDSTINNYLNMAKVYRKNVPQLDYDKMNSYIEDNIKDETQVKFDVEIKGKVAGSNDFNYNYFTYLGYIIIAAAIQGVGFIMFSFHNIDIQRRQTASPITNRNYNLQLLFANLIFVLGYLVLFIVAGFILNQNRRMNANTLFTWLNAVVFMLVALSISYLIGITVKSRNSISALSTGLSLGLSFLSGIFVPQKYLGSSVLKIASFTPSYWFVKANYALLNVTEFHWKAISDALGYMAIEIGFAAVFISIALVVSKRKRQQAC